MPLFTEPNDTVLDLVADRMVKMPHYADRFEAIKELREADAQGLTTTVADAAKRDGFFRVASITAPMKDLLNLLDPTWMKDKRQFYRFIDAHPEYVCYDRRKGRKT